MGRLKSVSGMVTVLKNALFYAATKDESRTSSVNCLSFTFSLRAKKENRCFRLNTIEVREQRGGRQLMEDV